jgi:polyhydroxyalkanoate synthesis regulator phasin
MKSALTQRDDRIRDLKQEIRSMRMTVLKDKDERIKSLERQVEKLNALLKFVGVDLG